MGFPRQGYWSGLPFPSPGDLPQPGIEPRPSAEIQNLLNFYCRGQSSLEKTRKEYKSLSEVYALAHLKNIYKINLMQNGQPGESATQGSFLVKLFFIDVTRSLTSNSEEAGLGRQLDFFLAHPPPQDGLEAQWPARPLIDFGFHWSVFPRRLALRLTPPQRWGLAAVGAGDGGGCCSRHLGLRGSGGGSTAPRLGSGSSLPLPPGSVAAAPPTGGGGAAAVASTAMAATTANPGEETEDWVACKGGGAEGVGSWGDPGLRGRGWG